ncbi:MAG: 6-phosphogluconolactonase [Candidatus Electrothrix sp. AR4]|nr:6-phosphogluconolactonase [Candidatus Electrothrix sp. AR4]
MDVLTFPDRKKLINELADRIGIALGGSIAEHGQASLAVSGGSTPIQLFEQLAETDIPWQDVLITLVDERWVDSSSPDSNEQLVRQHLLKNRAATAKFIGLKNVAATAGKGAEECEQRLRQIPRPFTILILGMGNDGHTASLFPQAEQLPWATDMNSSKTCMAITPTAAPHERMTLTLPAMLNAEEIILHITGPEKKEVLAKAQTAGSAEEMPIRFVLRQQIAPITVYWAP